MGEAKKILENGKPIAGMIGQILLKWFNQPNPKNGKVDEKKKRLKKILDDGKTAPFYFSWTEKEEFKLVLLKTEPIYIHDTALTRLKS